MYNYLYTSPTPPPPPTLLVIIRKTCEMKVQKTRPVCRMAWRPATMVISYRFTSGDKSRATANGFELAFDYGRPCDNYRLTDSRIRS